MGDPGIRAKSRTQTFAWHYAFFARLAQARAPGSTAELLHLTQAVHAFRGHLDPIRVADEVLLGWPFDVPEPGDEPET
jgi:hypothetical protein